MGLLDWLKGPQTENGVRVDAMSLPVGALGPGKDDVVGRDEFGRSIYSTLTGRRYVIDEVQPAPRPEGGYARAAGRAIADDPLGVAGVAASGLLQGVWNGVSSPANALRGEYVSQGDAVNTAGLLHLGGAGMAAPAGALRAGAGRSVTPAQEVAGLLRAGRAVDVTDDMMARVDPQEMWRLYEGGATGSDMPMDAASRMQRAGEMGFDTGAPLYHATHPDFQAFTPPIKAGVDREKTQQASFFYTNSDPVRGQFGAYGAKVIPALARPVNLFDPSILQDNPSARWLDDSFSPLGRNLLNDIDAGDFGDVIADPEGYVATAASGQWDLIESKAFQDWMRKQGYQDFFVEESGNVNKAINDPRNIRSRFARFDPRLSHLSNLSATNASPLVGLLSLAQQNGYQDPNKTGPR